MGKFMGQPWCSGRSQQKSICLQIITRSDGRTVALSLKIGALNEDCARADVLIAALPVRRGCDKPELVVDRFDVFRDGATALSFDEDGIRVETVNDARGTRPWSKRVPTDQ